MERHPDFLRPAAAIAALSLLLVRPCSGMEIPLGQAESQVQKVAYVNMHKIFEAFPGTEKARAELRQQIDEKKAEITARKEEIAKLKGEVDFLRKQMSAVEPGKAPKAPPPEEEETQPAPESKGPDQVTPLALPPGSPMKFLFSPPQASTDVEKQVKPPVEISSSAPSILPGIPSPGPQLKDKEADLARKQADLDAFVGAAEADIKRMEEGQTMTIMAQIYKTLQDIAAKEGYSVVIDRENLLYGDKAVDITDQVIWKLSAPGATPGPAPENGKEPQKP